MRIHSIRWRGVLDALILLAIIGPTGAALAATATLNSASSWVLTHNPGGPGSSSTTLPGLAIQATSSPSLTYMGTKTFKPGGTTQGKAGVGRTQSTTVAKLVFPTGAGVGQTDPAPASQSASAVRIDFNGIFDITGGGTFGPTVNSLFSVPFGAKIGAGGFAQFGAHVEWKKKIGGVTTAARSNFDIIDSIPYTNGTNGTGGLFDNTAGGGILDVLETFTTNSAMNVSSIAGGGGNQLIVTGFIQFVSNNDDAPVFSDFPRDPFDQDPDPGQPDSDPFTFFQAEPGNAKEQAILNMVPESGFEVVEPFPEPAGLALIIGIPALLMRRYRRA